MAAANGHQLDCHIDNAMGMVQTNACFAFLFAALSVVRVHTVVPSLHMLHDQLDTLASLFHLALLSTAAAAIVTMERGRRRSHSPAERRADSREARDRRRRDRDRRDHRDEEVAGTHKHRRHRSSRHREQYTDEDSRSESDYSSDDSREARRKRHKKRDRHDRDRKERHKKTKKERKKDKKKEKERRRERTPSSDDVSSSDDASDNVIDHRKLEKLGVDAITDKDYFSRSTEFRVWLREKKRIYFDDLKGSEARRYFGRFMRAWNGGKLDAKYYSGIRSSQLASSELTKYQWGFAKNMNQDEVLAVRDTVDTATNSERVARDLAQRTQGHRDTGHATGALGGTAGRRPHAGWRRWCMHESADRQVAEMDDEDRRRYERGLRRKDTKSYRKAREADLEELAPKATGREAMIEKRRARSAYLHREPSPDPELPEADLMGGGDSYQAHLRSLEESRQRRMQHRQNVQTQRTSEMSERVAAHQRKEDATMAMFRQMVEQRGQRELQPR
ncbi:hypothetical protein SYNPS1DRAFT_26392 [Syncephalis pseudoplumigaleata]|uniref:Uncharacterized protein n=1 Tax=Syncephalis pseudoplumigaleata TaxID=1712513 RepID=A0A4P9Z5S3_9FUNG|nr:hypothetical protein SYNPS1DRAFT_26392 [Syncephalis pseudoplumigaleata]|eukprot:RKP27983.1 hypothetical protein SYNPS1DRAFT_26392 [Syncephalis pseudoplumigaleata]